MTTSNQIKQLNSIVKGLLHSLIPSMLPHGIRQGQHWVALNPTRADTKRGSFKVHLETGKWADYATGDGGGDVVSLAAYLYRERQGEAAKLVASMAGVSLHD